MIDDEEERKRKLEEARNIISNTSNLGANISNNNLYNQRLQEANSIINSINPSKTREITEEERQNSINNANSFMNLLDKNSTSEVTPSEMIITDTNPSDILKTSDELEKEKDEKKVKELKANANVVTTQNNNNGNNAISNFRTSNESLINITNANKEDNNNPTVETTSNAKIASNEETKNIKEASNSDVYLLTNGEVDNRNLTEKTIDTVTGVVENVGIGIADFVPSAIDYINSGEKIIIKNNIKNGLKLLGYSEKDIETITQTAMNNFNKYSILSNLNLLMNNDYKENLKNERIQRNILKASGNPLAEMVSESAPSIGSNIVSMALSAVNPVLGITSFVISAGGSYLDDARNRGMNDDQAFAYATVMGSLEGGTEYLITGKMVDKIGRKLIGKGLTDDVLNSFGVSVAENFLQEAVMEPLQEATATVTGGNDKADWDNIWGRMLEAGVSGVVSSVILSGASVGIASAENVVNKANPTADDYAQAIVDTINSGKVDVQGIIQGAQEAIINNGDTQQFYTTTFNQDGNVENVQAVRGKEIDNPNSKVNVTPVIVRNQDNSYNIIDGTTGILLDSSRYRALIEAQTEFNSKMINLDNASINNINNKIAQATIAIDNKINEVASNIGNENVTNTSQSGTENVINDTQTGTNNVMNGTNSGINNTSVDTNTNTSTNTLNNSNMNTDTYQTSQNQFTDNYNNETTNYSSNSTNASTSQNNALNDVTRLLSQISDNSIYSRQQTRAIIENISRNIPTVEIQQVDNTTYINSLDREGNVVRQQQITNRPYTGGEIRDLVNNAVYNADLSGINSVQTNQNGFRDVSNNETSNYMSNDGNVRNNVSNLSDEEIKNIVKYNPDGREISDENYIDFLVDRYKDNKNISGVMTDTKYVESIENKSKKDKISEMYRKIKNKEFKITKELRDKTGNLQTVNLDLIITKTGLNESFNKGFSDEKYAIVPYLDELIKTAQDGTIRAETKQRENILEWYYLYNTAEINGKLYGVKIDIKKTGQGDRFYVHRVNLIKKEGSSNLMRTPLEMEKSLNTLPSVNTSISQLNKNVKNDTNVTNKSMQNNKNNTKNLNIKTSKASGEKNIRKNSNNSTYNEQDNIEKELHNRIQNAILSRNSKGRTYLGVVSDKVVNKIKSLFGFEVSDRRHVLADNDIRHMIKEHGNPEIEKAKGQIAITTKDIEKIPDIIENYDRIVEGNDNREGKTIRYIKNYSDNISYVVEVVPEKGNALKIKTMWKKPVRVTNSKNTPSSTSKTKSGLGVSTSSKSIPQYNQNVKDNGIRAERTSNTTEYDNQGNKLTKAQQDFFKDSKVRDENGKLKVVYHGTNNEFTIFDRNKSGQSNSNAKIGFWFTETKEGARKFAESVWYGNKKSPEVFEVYLDIKKPKVYESIDNSNELNNLEEQMKNLKQRIRQIENKNINIEINSSAIKYASDDVELKDIAEQNGIIKKQNEFISVAKEYKKFLDNYDNVEREYNNKKYNDAYELFRTDIYKFAGKDANDANFGGTGMWLENESEILQKYKDNLVKQGYDGIIIQGTNYDSETMGRKNTQYVAFNSNQIKNITNKKPTTSNPDIRYENTDKSNTTNQQYNSRNYEENEDFMKYLNENEYLKNLMEVDKNQGETYAHSAERLVEQEIRKLEQTNGFDNSIPVTKLTDIDREIENYLGKTIGKGHFRERARGIYNKNIDRIRVKEYKDLDNVFHELGHALDLGRRITVDKASLSDELLAAVRRHGGYENESIGVQLDEGFAEILKTYAINKDIVRQDYPKSYKVLEDFKASNVEFGNFITKLQEDTYNYIHQSPRNRGLSNQSIGEQTDKETITIEKIAHKAVKTVYDSNYEVKRVQEEFSKATGHKPTPSQNAYLLTRLASGVDNKIVSMLTNGYVDENGNRLMPGLGRIGEILGNDPERINDLRAYLAARRDLEYKAKTLKTGLRTMDSKTIIEQFYNDAQIQEAAQVVYDTLDGVLQYAVDNGLITEENAKSLRESNVFYVPFQRVIEGRGNQVGRRGAVSDIIKQRTGSELDIKDVLENIVTNSANIIKQVENNNILRAVYEQGEETGMKNNVFDVIPAPMRKIGTEQLSTWEAELKRQGIDTSELDLDKTIDLFAPNNNIVTEKDGSHIVSFFDKNGKRKYLQFYKDSTDIFNSLMGLDKNANSTFLKIMRSANMPLRYGATMANVGFAIPNMISDTVQASIFSEAGFIPVVDNVLGVLDVLGATNKTVRNFLNQVAPEYAQRINNLYDIYQQTGATSSMRMAQYRKSAQEIMRDIYGTKNSESLGIKESFKPLKRLMDILTYIPELSESSTRFRVFERNYDAYINKGMSETDARIQAAIESRDATQDFGRTGTLMREVNQLIPFSAARVGSAYTFAERAKANPGRTAARVAILLAVTMAIKAIGYDDDEIEELNQRKKDDNFVLKIGDTVITIKKPQGILRSIVNLTEYIQDLVTGHIEEGKEGERLVEWATNAIMDNMPADSVTGLVPNAIAPVVENAINKDFYYNTDIVKSYDLDLPEAQQYYDYTSQLAIWLGQIFNYSPAKIDNLISGYLGGVGTQLTDIIDWVSGKLGFSVEEPDMGAEDNAIGKRFVVNVNENSASVDEIYEREEELTKKLNGGTITEEENEELENIKAGISKLSALNKQIKAIKQDLTMSGTEKADAIRPLQEQKTDVARQALGKDTIYTENTDELEALEFYPSRSTLSYNGLTLNLTEEMKLEYMDRAYELYNQYLNQGIYSEEYLEKLKDKVKDAAKKEMIQKYKNQLVK